MIKFIILLTAQDFETIEFIIYHFLLRKKMITCAEIECTGPGADMSKRVKWVKNLSEKEVRRLVSVQRFINQGMWLQEQLIHL